MKRTARNMEELTRAGNAAEDALAAINENDDDATVADAAANYLLTRHLPTWRFSVSIRAGKTFKMPYDWKYRNLVGIKTDDRDRAHAWLTAALLAGYGPMVHCGMSFAHGPGGIERIHARNTQERELEKQRRKRNLKVIVGGKS